MPPSEPVPKNRLEVLTVNGSRVGVADAVAPAEAGP